jgi:hypothetical protein
VLARLSDGSYLTRIGRRHRGRQLLTQAAGWTRLGLFTRVATGTYALNTPTDQDP